MRKTESLQVEIHAAKLERVRNRMAEVGESVNRTSELGVSFHSANYAKKQISTGKTELQIYNPNLSFYVHPLLRLMYN